MNDHPTQTAEDLLMSDRGFLLIAQAMYMAHRALRAQGQESNSEGMLWLLENHPILKQHLAILRYQDEFKRDHIKGGPLKAVTEESDEECVFRPKRRAVTRRLARLLVANLAPPGQLGGTFLFCFAQSCHT